MNRKASNNEPIDSNTPIVPEQAKEPETPETRVQQELKKEETKVVEFKKDVKFLWLYATVFCVVLLALIGGSSIIQRKIHKQVEGYKSQAISAEQTSSQNLSRLSNIQDENEQLKAANKKLTEENESLKIQAETDNTVIQTADGMMVEMQKLCKAAHLYEDSKYSQATDLFKTIQKEKLPENMKEIYNYYKERLN